MTSVTWRRFETKADTLPRVPIRGIRGLPGSDHPAFPESIPHIGDSLYHVRPDSADHGLDELAVGAGELMRRKIGARPAILFNGVPVTSWEEFGEFCAGRGSSRMIMRAATRCATSRKTTSKFPVSSRPK